MFSTDVMEVIITDSMILRALTKVYGFVVSSIFPKEIVDDSED